MDGQDENINECSGFPGGSVMKNPAKQETEKNAGCSLGWVDPLEEETATHSSILV